MVCFKPGAEIVFQATADSSVMVLGGEIFPEKRFIWWNFVSSSHERLEKAKLDWKEGRFTPVIDETEYIPLPEK
jgi:redox-sensitive bicupin YhaK (pirin superfamily)